MMPALLFFTCVELGETAVVVMAQTPEAVEGYHFQVGAGANVWQHPDGAVVWSEA